MLSLVTTRTNKEEKVMKVTTKDIIANALIAALYVVLTLITYPISYLGIQFRFAEIMVLLCFWRKDYSIGLIIGCAIANLASSIGLVDVGFGTLATVIACVGIMFMKQLAIACLFPIVANAFIVGFELYQFLGLPFWLSVGEVAIGEATVMVVGYVLFMVLKRRNKFFEVIRANQNIAFKW